MDEGFGNQWRAGTQAAPERFQRGEQINPATLQALGLNPSTLEMPGRQGIARPLPPGDADDRVRPRRGQAPRGSG